jgi:hypothetical protein
MVSAPRAVVGSQWTTQPFPISPRNSVPAISDLLRKTSTHRLFVTRGSLSDLCNVVKTELAESGHELSLEEVPALDAIFPKLAHETATDPFERMPLPDRGAFAEDVLMYCHSSGSTVDWSFLMRRFGVEAELQGFPKPIPWTVKFTHSFTWMDVFSSLRESGVDICKLPSPQCTHSC